MVDSSLRMKTSSTILSKYDKNLHLYTIFDSFGMWQYEDSSYNDYIWEKTNY